MCRYGSSAEQQQHLLVVLGGSFSDHRVLRVGPRLVGREGRAALANAARCLWPGALDSLYPLLTALWRAVRCVRVCVPSSGRWLCSFMSLVLVTTSAAEVPVVFLCPPSLNQLAETAPVAQPVRGPHRSALLRCGHAVGAHSVTAAAELRG